METKTNYTTRNNTVFSLFAKNKENVTFVDAATKVVKTTYFIGVNDIISIGDKINIMHGIGKNRRVVAKGKVLSITITKHGYTFKPYVKVIITESFIERYAIGDKVEHSDLFIRKQH